MDEKIRSLYQKVILEHNKSPYHYGEPHQYKYHLEADNHVCGDRFEIFLTMQDNHIHEIHFKGYGCAISKAATSVLLQKIDQQSTEEALNFIQQFLDYITNENSSIPFDDLDESLQAFAAARDFPERQSCVTLSWETLREYLSA